MYAPLGLALPVILEGKLILQQLVIMGKKANNNPLGWDDPLPEDMNQRWSRWKDNLPKLEEVSIPHIATTPKDLALSNAERY